MTEAFNMLNFFCLSDDNLPPLENRQDGSTPSKRNHFKRIPTEPDRQLNYQVGSLTKVSNISTLSSSHSKKFKRFICFRYSKHSKLLYVIKLASNKHSKCLQSRDLKKIV